MVRRVLQVDGVLEQLLCLAAIIADTAVKSLSPAGYIVVLLEGDVVISSNDDLLLCRIIFQPLAEGLHLLKFTRVGEISCHQAKSSS